MGRLSLEDVEDRSHAKLAQEEGVGLPGNQRFAAPAGAEALGATVGPAPVPPS